MKKSTNHLPQMKFQYDDIKKVPKATHMLGMKAVNDLKDKSANIKRVIAVRRAANVAKEVLKTKPLELFDVDAEIENEKKRKISESSDLHLKDRSYSYKETLRQMHDCKLLQTLHPVRSGIGSLTKYGGVLSSLESESSIEMTEIFRPHYISTKTRLGDDLAKENTAAKEGSKKTFKKEVGKAIFKTRMGEWKNKIIEEDYRIPTT